MPPRLDDINHARSLARQERDADEDNFRRNAAPLLPPQLRRPRQRTGDDLQARSEAITDKHAKELAARSPEIAKAIKRAEERRRNRMETIINAATPTT